MDVLTVLVGLCFKFLVGALPFERHDCANERLAVRVDHFACQISGLGETGSGDKQRQCQDRQELAK